MILCRDIEIFIQKYICFLLLQYHCFFYMCNYSVGPEKKKMSLPKVLLLMKIKHRIKIVSLIVQNVKL